MDLDPVAQAEVPRPEGALDFAARSYPLPFCDLDDPDEAATSRRRKVPVSSLADNDLDRRTLSLSPTVER